MALQNAVGHNIILFILLSNLYDCIEQKKSYELILNVVYFLLYTIQYGGLIKPELL